MLAIIERHFESVREKAVDDLLSGKTTCEPAPGASSAASELQDESDPYDGMSTDRAFLEGVADYFEGKRPEPPTDTPTMVRNLRSIAIGCDQLAVEKIRLNKLEERVDQFLCTHIEVAMGIRPECDASPASLGMLQVMTTWLLSRRTRSAGAGGTLGAGIGGFLGGVFGKAAGEGVTFPDGSKP